MSLFPSASVAVFWLLPLAAAEPLPDLATVQTHYTATVSAVHTLECDFTVTLTKSATSGKLPYTTHHTLWRKGSLRAVQSTSPDADGRPNHQSWRGYNGKTYAFWGASLENPPASLPTGTIERDKDNLLYGDCRPDLFTGETYFEGDYPLAELMKFTPPPTLSWETLDSVRCLKLSFPRHRCSRMLAEPRTETIVWLDPALGYLPRRAEMRNYPITGEPPTQRVDEWVMESLDYQTVTGGDGRTYHWPMAGVRDNWLGTQEFKVTRIRINEPIATELFSPQFPALAEIWEKDAEGKRKIRIHGDVAARQKLEASLIERVNAQHTAERAAAVPVSAPDAAVDPAQQRWQYALPIGMAILGTAALLLSVLLVRRS